MTHLLSPRKVNLAEAVLGACTTTRESRWRFSGYEGPHTLLCEEDKDSFLEGSEYARQWRKGGVKPISIVCLKAFEMVKLVDRWYSSLNL